MTTQRITIVGATSGPGKSLLLKLGRKGYQVTGIGRDPEKIEQIRRILQGSKAVIQAIDVSKDLSFLESTDILVHCSRPDLVHNLLSENLSRFIALGSTRKFTHFPDQRCRDVETMERMVMSSSIPATVLHPTLIYGADGFSNIERIIGIARKFPVIPLPRGGMSLIQPVHCDDVSAALMRCLDNDRVINQSIVIAGPSPMTYRTFVQTTLAAMNLTARVISMPCSLIKALAGITRYLPGVPLIRSDEVQRLLEDKNFDTHQMQNLLSVIPRSFDTGIRQYAAELQESRSKPG